MMRSIFKTGFPELNAKYRLYAISLVMLSIFIAYGYGITALTAEEKRAINKVRAMQASLWEWINSAPVRAEAARWAKNSDWEDFAPSSVDPGKSGLIGVEWSEITTTLGPLAVKQASTDPMWAAHILRWFDKVGLERGDRIMILASGSFPGFLVSALAASETRALQIELAVSLGASTWGANRMESPWPLLELRLRNSGYLQTKSRYYTPGGRGETGENYSIDAMNRLEEASGTIGVPFMKLGNLNEVILMKTESIREYSPKLLVLIGGSASVAGGSDEILPPGLILPGTLNGMGKGVAKAAIADGIPVLHLLNVQELSRQTGSNSLFKDQAWQVAGLICFFLVMLTHRRWTWG